MNMRFVASVVSASFLVGTVAQTLEPLSQVSAVLLAKDIAGLWTFSVGDFIDLPSLASKLKHPTRAFDSWLAAHLSPATLALANYQGQGSDPAPLQQALLQDLNGILGGASIYEQQRFAGVVLRTETQTLISQNPQGSDLERLNRLLIEDAYPLEVSRNHIGQGRPVPPLGSGFFLNLNSNWFLVTAKHVLYARVPGSNLLGTNLVATNMTCVFYATTGTNEERVTCRIPLRPLLDAQELRPHATRDVVVCRLGRTEPITNSPGHFRFTYPKVLDLSQYSGNFMWFETNQIDRFAAVAVGNDGYIFGFPTSLASPFSTLDPLRPLLRRITVAGKDPSQMLIVVDCPVYWGNSGGPATQLKPQTSLMVPMPARAPTLIGVVVDMVPVQEHWVNPEYEIVNVHRQNAGYAIVEPIDFVLELVDSWK